MSPIRLDCFLEIQTENLYQVPMLSNTTTITATTTNPPATTFTTTTTTTTTATTTITWDHGGFHMKVLAKTPGLYQVPKLRNTTTTTTTIGGHGGFQKGDPRENTRSLSSPKA